MKKIMFNDKYGLTDAALQGRKTMTRRIVKDGTPLGNWGETEKYAKYKIGEVVAVAQSYKSIFEESLNYALPRYHWLDDHIDEKGFENKMFVKADLMPHHIRITDIKVERLQDISDKDCLKEGVVEKRVDEICYTVGDFYLYDEIKRMRAFNTPRDAFAALIDKVSGKGTWDSNPWVFAYTFELVR